MGILPVKSRKMCFYIETKKLKIIKMFEKINVGKSRTRGNMNKYHIFLSSNREACSCFLKYLPLSEPEAPFAHAHCRTDGQCPGNERVYCCCAFLNISSVHTCVRARDAAVYGAFHKKGKARRKSRRNSGCGICAPWRTSCASMRARMSR